LTDFGEFLKDYEALAK